MSSPTEEGEIICDSLADSREVEGASARVNFNSFTKTLWVRIMNMMTTVTVHIPLTRRFLSTKASDCAQARSVVIDGNSDFTLRVWLHLTEVTQTPEICNRSRCRDIICRCPIPP